MSKQLTATLWGLKKEREKSGTPQVVVPINQQRKEGSEKKELPEWLFFNSIGGNVDVNNWRRCVFYKALTKAGLRRIRIHDLRHTYATLRISKGDNVADVSNQLGHHSVKLTMHVYYHWMPGKKKGEVDALDDPSYLHPSAPYTHPNGLESRKVLR
jgi:integrase